MRRLLLLLAFILAASPAFAATIPLTGQLRLVNGNRFNGRLVMTLNYPATDTTSGQLVSPQSMTYPINNGSVAGVITPNDILSPANTIYVAQVFTAAGALVRQNNFYVAGSQFDIGTATPTALTSSNISFNVFTGLTDVETAVINNTQTCQRTGATAGAKLAAAIAAGPSTGVVVDCRGLQGTQTVSADIFSGVTKPGILLLGAATFNASVPQNIPANWTIKGSGQGLTIWVQTVNVPVTPGETAGDGFRITGANIAISDMTVRGAAGTSPAQNGEGSTGLIWRSGANHTTLERLTIERFANRGIQCGATTTGIRASNLLLQDFGQEGALIYDCTDVIIRDSEVTRYRAWALDTNAGNVHFIHNYVHDALLSTDLNDAGGLVISGSSLVNSGVLQNASIVDNTITNMYPGSHGFVNVSAGTGATVSNIIVADNHCTSATAEACTYYEPSGTGTGVLKGIVTVGNVGWNAFFYTKEISNFTFSANTTTATIGNSGYGVNFETLGTGILITGNVSFGWNTAAKITCTQCITANNLFSALTTPLTDAATAPYVSGPNILVGGTDSRLMNLNSSTGGFMSPRMTDTQRTAAGTILESTQIANTTRHELQYYDGTAWNASVVLANPTFTNSWVNLGGGGNPPVAVYWKGQNQHVYIVGAIKNGTNNTSAFTLPSGFRPPQDTLYNVVGTDGFNFLPTQVTVANGGGVTVNIAGASGGATAGVYFGLIDVPTVYDK